MRIDAVQNAELETFSTLQRVEIAEILTSASAATSLYTFSTLQRVEIAEIRNDRRESRAHGVFQYSSTSRNC